MLRYVRYCDVVRYVTLRYVTLRYVMLRYVRYCDVVRYLSRYFDVGVTYVACFR